MDTFWLILLPLAVVLGFFGLAIGGRTQQVLVLAACILAGVDLVYLLATH